MREESEWSYTQMIPKDAPYINIIEEIASIAIATFKLANPKAGVNSVEIIPEQDRVTTKVRFVNESHVGEYLDLGKEVRQRPLVPLGTSLWSPEVNRLLPKGFALVPSRSGYIPENFVLEILHEGRPVGTCSGQSWVIFYEHGIVIKSINSDHAKAFVIPSET